MPPLTWNNRKIFSVLNSIHVHVFPWHKYWYCMYFHVHIYTYTVHVFTHIYIYISFFKNSHIRRKDWDGQVYVWLILLAGNLTHLIMTHLSLWQRSFKTLNEGTNLLEKKRGKHLWIRTLFELWIFGYFKMKLKTSLFLICLSSQSTN